MKKKNRLSNLNILGIPVDPSLGVGDKIIDYVDESTEAERKKEAASTYWARCPFCGKKMVKQELIEKGCWACGWRGTEEEIELAKVKRESRAIGQEGKAVGESYKTRCPNCGKLVITKELKEKGCYICGWKLSSPLKGEE